MNTALHTIHNDKYGGINVYLTQRHFHMMIAAAAVIHILAVSIYALIPQQDVLDIPVRILNVKLAGPSIAPASAGKINVKEPKNLKSAASMNALPSKKTAVSSKKASLPASVSQKSVAAAPAKSRLATKKEAKKPSIKPHETRGEKAVNAVSAAFETKKLPASSGRAPSQFVRTRETAVGSGGSIYGNSSLSEKEVVRRYEQILSLWIEQHKVYPAEARRHKQQGNAVVRIRIDRKGNILRFRLEQVTGHSLIDSAIGQMIAAANPVPAIPDNYPAGEEVEFLVPVSFRVLN